MEPRPKHQKPIPAAAYVLSVATRAFSTMMTSRGVRSVRSIEAALRELPDTPWLVWLQYHWQYSLSCSDGGRLIATRLGYVGVTPSTVAPGDQIVMGPGEGHPLVLRCEEGYHTFRGLAYVWGVTDPDSHSGDYESLLAARDRFTDRSQLAGYHLC